MKQIFEKVLKDNLSGSGEILLQVQQVLLALEQPAQKIEVTTLLKQLNELEDKFPHFALLFHFLQALRAFIAEDVFTEVSQLTGFVRKYQLLWENVQQKASENLLRSISFSGKNILNNSKA